jgi:uncharacterized BrkB/YihY/UPF0761 family membrane protein
MLLWLYYSSLIFFTGAILTALLVERQQDRELPPGPEYVTLPRE